MQGHKGTDQIKARTKSYALDLSLKSQKPVTLQYGTGWMYVGADRPFYYYSYTRMTATGTITVDGKAQPVTGEVWMDHQWGTIGEGYGWDWFSLRMDDDSELMLFKVRRQGAKGFAGGTMVRADGTALALTDADFTITDLGKWTSPHTKTTYSHGWKLAVPSLSWQATVTPVMKDQEFSHSVMGSPTYWEGLCDVSGTRAGKAAPGHAYVEITGKIPTLDP
jgi:predicted secreted hydrolase